MKQIRYIINSFEKNSARFGILLLLLLFTSCASMDPRNVDVELKEEAPEAKITNFSGALTQLGSMTEIYGSPLLKVQSKDIADNTGTAGATGGEVPRDITEMLKSTLNSVGGKVTFIPYNPSFIQNQMVTGYSSFDEKMIPDVVITGGITEFDRGLETRGSNVDASAQVDWTGAPSWVPSTTTAADFGAGDKFGLASITLDFNMIDFRTMAGIARMQTVNTMKVTKAVSERELGITLFGPTFGLRGSIKKVQGRHAAVRLLVQLSMIQVIGKYLMLPYWNLLPNGEPDPVVMDALKKYYYQMDSVDKIVKVQELLFVQGYDVPISGEMDAQTAAAIQQVVPGFNPGDGTVDRETFINIYTSVPITDATLERRMALNKAYEEAAMASAAPKPAAAPAPAPAKQAAAQPAASQPQQAAVAEAPANPPAQPASAADGDFIGGGRRLSEDEW